ncbi:MAG: class I SAM-dependent methyltransferase [Actinobacteria bacterium]|nr:class I SAM-dependent methyltransferase [Actinomycetota bacterium]
MRSRRWGWLYDRFPDLGSMRVLDLGGTTDHWLGLPVRPEHLTILNVYEQECDDPAIDVLVGDACDPVGAVGGRSFDLVYSNSVIEHVGGHQRRELFAQAVRDLAPSHWVQTPYRYFPIEPHWLFPGFQFLPVAVRARITRRWPFGFNQRAGSEAVDVVLSTELIDKTQMRHLFPDSALVVERAAGLPKSLIATVGGGSG